ncbi:MAG: hypothetical protein OEM94_03415 [Acidimicrobiia bacterium]|nr:hypothetical protein [Acidimicrobiia bacterium]
MATQSDLASRIKRLRSRLDDAPRLLWPDAKIASVTTLEWSLEGAELLIGMAVEEADESALNDASA